MTQQNIKVMDLKYHRNGISGVGFIAARFTFEEDKKTYSAIATLFDSESKDRYYAILTEGDNGKIDISATWRGDHFADKLYTFVESEAGQKLMFPALYSS